VRWIDSVATVRNDGVEETAYVVMQPPAEPPRSVFSCTVRLDKSDKKKAAA
jgi:hypothetical protein